MSYLILVLRAYWKLILFDPLVARGRFSVLYDKVGGHSESMISSFPNMTENICSAIDMACIWYWKEVRCLQRSAATVALLRAHGIHCRLTIGVQQMPFKAHAWVEVDDRVVNDKPYMREIYAILEQR
jgi:hypothetical protein